MIHVCDATDIPTGKGRAFSLAMPDGSTLEVLIVNVDGELFAYRNACAHFGVRLDVAPDYDFIINGEIVCQVHYAGYDPRTGACRVGDCFGEGLTPLSLHQQSQSLYLDPEQDPID